MNLRDKVALVTGASSGIGRAIASCFAREGMRLALCARRTDRLETLCAELESNHPGLQTLALPTDLRDETRIASAFSRIRSAWGGVDVLVNNAGLGRKAPLCSGATEDWREMLEVNVLALCICTREAIKDMRARGDHGHVVHIASMAGHRVPLHSGVYSASKFAVRSLTEGLRAELRELDSDIRVTAISPGFVETEFAEVYNHGDTAAAQRTYGAYPVLQPSDIADAVRYVVTSPPHVQFHDLLLRPTRQPS